MLQYDNTVPPHLSASRPTPGPLQEARTSSSSLFSSISSSSSSSLSSASSSSSSSSAPDRHNLPQQHHQQQRQTAVCAACRQVITDRYLLRAVDETWHEECLRCSSCDCCLGRIGSSLFTKDDLLLCKHDYLRLYGVSGVCSSCSKMIPAFEMVMRAGDNVYHLDCFYCAECKSRFCVGDRYYLSDDQTILCEYDYHLYQRQTHHQHQHHQQQQQQHQQIASWLSSSSMTTSAGHSVAGQRSAGPTGQHGLTFRPPSSSTDDNAGDFPRTMPPQDKAPSSSSLRSAVDSPTLHDDASSGYGSPSPDTTTTTTMRHHGAP